MQNQPYTSYRIENSPINLCDHFPITDLYDKKHSPSSDDISYMHFHNYLEIGYCYEGCGVFFINDKVLPFSAGDVSIIFPNEIHIAQSDGLMNSQWQFVTLDPVTLLSNLNMNEMSLILNVIKGYSSFSNIIGKNDVSGIAGLIFEMFCELEMQGNHYKSAVKSQVWSLMIKLARKFELLTEKSNDNFRRNISKIAPALNYISENYIKQIGVSELACMCKLSVTHFRRLFTFSMGLAPSEYINSVRIKIASILLLRTEQSILEISMSVGYSSLSSFNRHFKSIMSVSPRTWKKSNATLTAAEN